MIDFDYEYIRPFTNIKKEITKTFIPAAIKFNFIFILHDECQLLQGVFHAMPNVVNTPEQMIQLPSTDSIHVYNDRIVYLVHYQKVMDIVISQIIKILKIVTTRDEQMLCAFPPDGDDSVFDKSITPIVSLELANYSVMNNSLFDDAIENILQIAKGINNPQKNMLFIFLGRSGKKNLVRLASYLEGCNAFRFNLASNYNMAEIGADLIKVFNLINCKKQPQSKVIQNSSEYFEAERKHNYATQESYMEPISLYKKTIIISQQQYSKGSQDSYKEAVIMKKKLEDQAKIIADKQAERAALIDQILQDTAIVKMELIAAQREKEQAEERQAFVFEELRKEQILRVRAMAALDCIDRKCITELSSFSSPPGKVGDVMEAIVLILSEGGRPAPDLSWKAAKKLICNTNVFMYKLHHLHENWNDNIMQLTKQKVAKWTFKESDVIRSSSACANIYAWLNNILNYYTIIQNIISKKREANEAEELLNKSIEKLKKVQAKATALEDQLQKLNDQF